jgi:chemotaxis signal transduction protein
VNKSSEQVTSIEKEGQDMKKSQDQLPIFEDSVETLNFMGISIKRLVKVQPKVDRQIIMFQVHLQNFAFLAEVVQEIVPMSSVYEDQLFANMEATTYKGQELTLIDTRHHIFREEASEAIPVHGHYLIILRNPLGGFWGVLLDSPYTFHWVNETAFAPVTLTHPSLRYIHRVSWFSIRTEEKTNLFLLDRDKMTQAVAGQAQELAG